MVANKLSCYRCHWLFHAVNCYDFQLMAYNVLLPPLYCRHTGQLAIFYVTHFSPNLMPLSGTSFFSFNSPKQKKKKTQKLTIVLFLWKNKIRRPLEHNICLEAVLLLDLLAFKAIPCSALYGRMETLILHFPGSLSDGFLLALAKRRYWWQIQEWKKRLQNYFSLSYFPHSSSPARHACPSYIFYRATLDSGNSPVPSVPLVNVGQQLLVTAQFSVPHCHLVAFTASSIPWVANSLH